MRKLLFACMILLPLLVCAEPITFTNAVTTYIIPQGFAVSADAPNDKWRYFVNNNPNQVGNGAGVRVMPPMSSTLMPDENGSYGLAWMAQLNDIPFDGALFFSSSFRACADGECLDLNMRGSLGYSPGGLAWIQKPEPLTFVLNNVTYTLLPTYSTKTGIVDPRDVGFQVKVSSGTIPTAPTPEPATLLLLGSGLAYLGVRLKRKI